MIEYGIFALSIGGVIVGMVGVGYFIERYLTRKEKNNGT